MNDVLKDLGILPKKVAPTLLPKSFKAPWAGLMYEQFTVELFDQLAKHLHDLGPAKAQAYRSFLHQHCGFPKDGA
jgi:hypothetical protein